MPSRRNSRRPSRRPRRAPRRGRKVAKRSSKKRGLSPMNQYAKIVESFQAEDLSSDKPYQHTFSLQQFYRATTIAKNFQFYKAVKVKWEYMPLYNTFQESNSTAVVGKPQLYFQMNRDQNPAWSQRTSAEALFSMNNSGVDPQAFTSNKEIIYKPNWCSPGISALTFGVVQGIPNPISAVTNVISLGLKKQFGWLPTPDLDDYDNARYNPTTAPQYLSTSVNTGPTNNAGVVYNGHNLYISQDNEPDTPVCRLICTVEWLFKNPKDNYSKLATRTPAQAV